MVRALQYLGRAAAQGYAPARVRLGDYYYYGWGTDVDFASAAVHYRIASDHCIVLKLCLIWATCMNKD